ncbi:UNKNOWN [Stylonychia lemnae]|uniref:Uncharacterized protein n=1 Tax=Stylonychia lemnae TaxID=5949 RepID=A0A078AE44_STYLE|nr:UNKNOWN [Stylonychia lemnae]|eukprot:CDW79787.1 UNKNOWN [Stylonychia lemnae]
MERRRSPSQIIEDIKSQIVCYSKAAKTTEQMYGNLQKKEYQDISWSKPKTPEQYFNVKESTYDKIDKVKQNKKLVQENKILSSMFRSIDRETRIKNVDPKLAIPTLNQLGNPPKLGEMEQSRIEYEQGVSQLKRNKSVMSKSINFNGSKSRIDDHDDEHNDTIRDLKDHLQDAPKNPLTIHKQLGSNLNKSQSQKALPDNSKVNISRLSSLPDLNLERSGVQPHIQNFKFSRQTKRKPINDLDVNENRFENMELFPNSLAKNKKLFWNIKMEKYKERDTTWVEKNAPQLSYNQVELDKFKFQKSYQPMIFSQHNTNKKHHFIVGRPF